VGTNVAYAYDPIGQLTAATSSISSENRGYAYDAAWNLNILTNNGALTGFSVNDKNELTTVGSDSFTYDANGNLTAQGGTTYAYDDENRLFAVTDGTSETEFVYDGLGRLREQLQLTLTSGGGGGGGDALRGGASPDTGSTWTVTGGIYYIYDGKRVIQERNTNSIPTVSYTRGTDLSGTLEGAGGVGGLLARSGDFYSGNFTNHNYYHADGLGNITYLETASQGLAASYRYDPFGNTLTSSGSLATANAYQFSSKEYIFSAGFYNYGYRFYSTSWQRWPNRDPIEEDGGINLYSFVGNDSVNQIDSYGLQIDGAATPGIGAVLMTPEELAAAQAAAARAAARLAAAAAAAASTSFCKAPKDPCKGLRDQLNAHLQKLQDYIADPEGHDNLGTLKNNPGLRERLIDGRIRALQRQINNFRKLLDACEKANGM
jgi:RHS repeat-associated protein